MKLLSRHGWRCGASASELWLHSTRALALRLTDQGCAALQASSALHCLRVWTIIYKRIAAVPNLEQLYHHSVVFTTATMAHAALDRERHIKYWKRCHGTFLPAPYTSNDSSRLTLACFIVSSLDLLQSPLTPNDRAAIRRWVLSLQHPDGGFCGSSTHVQQQHGTANLAAAFFALVLLGLAAGDDPQERKAAFAGVKRKRLLRWLKKLQQPDGAFGQLIWEGESVGGTDMRHCYMAAGIRWMLRGNVAEGDEAWVDDIDVAKLRQCIQNSRVC